MLNWIAKTKIQRLLKILLLIGVVGFAVNLLIVTKYGLNQMLNLSGGIAAFVAGVSYSLIRPFDMLSTIKGFLYTFAKLIIAVLLSYLFICSAIGSSSELILFGMVIIPIIVWIILSYYAKNSIAILINEISTIIFTVCIFSDDVVLEWFEIEKNVLEIMKILDVVILLMLIANGTATAMCLIKKYKIDEENNGVDPFETAYEKYKLEEQKNKNKKKRDKQKLTFRDLIK